MRHLLVTALWASLAATTWGQSPAWDGKGPAPDPIDQGDRALHLRLVDARSGDPLASEVILWRRDAPATQYWSAGDQRQRVVDVGAQGTWVRELPAGRYAVIVAAERADAPHQADVALSQAETRVTLTVERATKRTIRVRVHDAQGRTLNRMPSQILGRSTTGAAKLLPPPDHRPRACLVEPAFGFGAGAHGCYASNSVRLSADDEGFIRVGRLRGNTRGVERRADWLLEPEGLSPVLAEVSNTKAHPGDRYLATAIEPERVLERLLQPSGRLGAEQVLIHSRLLPWSPQPDAWLDAPIQVRVDDPRFQPLEVTFTLREGLPLQRLRPRD